MVLLSAQNIFEKTAVEREHKTKAILKILVPNPQNFNGKKASQM